MAEDGSSTRGVPGKGCWLGLVLLPLLLLRALLADLHPTPARLALLRAVDEGGGRIYYEAPSKDVWDKATAYRVTERIREMVAAGWIRATNWDADDRLPGELKRLVYYRLTEAGESILSKGKQR